MKPDISTDNLYKFRAVAGLVVTIATGYASYY